MTLQNKTPGHDNIPITFSREGFFGGASASATSQGVSTDTYKKVTALIQSISGATVTAAGVAALYNPEWSSDQGTTWVQLAEINGTTIPSVITHNPSTSGDVLRAYVYPAAMPLFRLRISGSGAAATGVTARATISLQP